MGYCIDTGPLLDYFVLRYFAERSASNLETVSLPHDLDEVVQGLTAPLVRRAFVKMLKRVHPITTISGAVVEVGYHVRSRARLHTMPFWRAAKDSFQSLQIVECHSPLEGLDERKIPEVGIVDEAILQHCVVHRAKLVSNDRRAICERAIELGVEVLHPVDLLDEFGD